MSNPWELTKILRDLEGSPIPQIFNPSEAIFNPLTGANLGNGRYGADNIMWGKTAAGVLVPVQVNADGTVVTSLSGSIPSGANTIGSVNITGRKVERVEALVYAENNIAAGSYKLSSAFIDISKYKAISLLVTCDQSYTISAYFDDGFLGSGPILPETIQSSLPATQKNVWVWKTIPKEKEIFAVRALWKIANNSADAAASAGLMIFGLPN